MTGALAIPEWASLSYTVDFTTEYHAANKLDMHTSDAEMDEIIRRDERFENALFGMPGVEQVCINHQCWARVTPPRDAATLEAIERHMQQFRLDLLRLLRECYS